MGHSVLQVPVPQLEGFAREVEPFDFVLARVATFPNGIIHLVPDPDGPFRGLTERVWSAFPECPPYAGEFTPAPHLTLDLASGEVTEESTRAQLDLPVTCRAERIDLAWYEPRAGTVLRTWPLG